MVTYSIVQALFWADADTSDFSLNKSLYKRPKTRLLPLVINSCLECCYPMPTKIVYQQKTAQLQERSQQLSYLLLVLKTGLWLTALSGSAWAQSQTTEDNSESLADEPPDQSLPHPSELSPGPEGSQDPVPESSSEPAFATELARKPSTSLALAPDPVLSEAIPAAPQTLETLPDTSIPDPDANQIETAEDSMTSAASTMAPAPQSPEPVPGALPQLYEEQSHQFSSSIAISDQFNQAETQPTADESLLAAGADLPLPLDQAPVVTEDDEILPQTQSTSSDLPVPEPPGLGVDQNFSTTALDLLPVSSPSPPSAMARPTFTRSSTASQDLPSPATAATRDRSQLNGSNQDEGSSPNLNHSTAGLPVQAFPAPSTVSRPSFTVSSTTAQEPPSVDSVDADHEPLLNSPAQDEGQPLNADASTTVSIPPGVLSPVVTTIPFDQVALDYGTRAQISTGISFGNDRSTNLHYNGLVNFNQTVESRSGPDNRTTLIQRQQVLSIRDLPQERRLTISIGEPLRLLSQDIQFSLTGSCLDPEVGDICTYTPGLITDETSIDPSTQFPTRFEQTSNFGDVVLPETLAAIQAPGFQRGTDIQEIGVDLRLPNIGVLPNFDADNGIETQREEVFATTPALGYTTINQTVQANATEAALARTIRGPVVILDPDQSVLNIALAALALVLPEKQVMVAATEDPANPAINLRLFTAANNVRLPLASLTLYQAGSGHATTPSDSAEEPQDEARARFNSIWLGLSPVTERSLTQTIGFRPLGEREVMLAAGGEGGGREAATLTSIVGSQVFDVNVIDNIYTQNYVTIYQQDVLNQVGVEQIERIRYYPHLSFSANNTGTYNSFRYYAGTIAGPSIQTYGGLDYQGYTDSGLFYRTGAIGVINPNYDRYSNLWGEVNQQLTLPRESSLTLGTGFNWAIDQDNTIGDIEQRGDGSNIFARARWTNGSVSLGATQTLGDILPNSQPTRTVLDTAIRIGDSIALTGFWAPFSANTSEPVLGALADVTLRLGRITPNLQFSWANQRFNYGKDPSGSPLTAASDTFSLSFRMRW